MSGVDSHEISGKYRIVFVFLNTALLIILDHIYASDVFGLNWLFFYWGRERWDSDFLFLFLNFAYCGIFFSSGLPLYFELDWGL